MSWSVIKFVPFGALDFSVNSQVVKSGFKTFIEAEAYIEVVRFLPEFEGELLGVRATASIR